MNYALIDMGSNSIRLMVYELQRDGFKILFREKLMAGLAGYVEHGRLTRDGIDCACHGLSELQTTLKLLRIERLAVFATASLRNVSNTGQAVEQIRRATGVRVEVLTGEEEAEFGFCGALCDMETGDGLYADIGGASVELVPFTGGRLQKAVSVPVGSLKLYRDCVKGILPGKSSRLRIRETIETAFHGMEKDTFRREEMVCVGGTARAALRLAKKLFGLSGECRTMEREQLKYLTRLLCKGDKAAADLILRYEPERIHTLVPGVMLLWQLVERFSVSRVTVSRYGVREGYLRRRIQPSLPAETEPAE